MGDRWQSEKIDSLARNYEFKTLFCRNSKPTTMKFNANYRLLWTNWVSVNDVCNH